MHNVREIAPDLYWIGANDNRLELFENIHPIPEGVSYNSYLLLDEKTVLFDTVDWAVGSQFLENIAHVLGGRDLDYLIINHMEPDHAASVEEVLIRYPNVKIILTNKANLFMGQFGFDTSGFEVIEVKEGDELKTGSHELMFIEAPMVHWPETMVTFDKTNGVLFSADAFGTFGTLDGRIFNDEMDFEREYLDHARRYYTNIVGKYGVHTMKLLEKAQTIDIKMLAPLHGPVWRTDLGWFIDKYVKWATYTPEEEGVLIVYGSMYGNTEAAANKIAVQLAEKGITNIKMYDVSKTHPSYIISDAFRLSHIVLASVTYNLNLFPPMKTLLHDMKMLNLQNRKVALVENGSWAPTSGREMRAILESMRNIEILDNEFNFTSAAKELDADKMDMLVDTIVESFKKEEK